MLVTLLISWKVILVKALHQSNAFAPMVRTLFGIITLFRAEQL
jgi:hypothetical protein